MDEKIAAISLENENEKKKENENNKQNLFAQHIEES